MANVLLGVTGSVAAVRTPLLYQSLTAASHVVRVIATDAACYFFDPTELPPGVLIRDADEWPGERYHRDDAVLHIELRRWADLFVVAPLDANTLAKLSAGICDNCLTCVWRAWDVARPVVLAPAMNTLMWDHPLTERHLKAVAADTKYLTFVGPITKALACGDIGVGAMAEVADIAAAVTSALAAPGR